MTIKQRDELIRLTAESGLAPARMQAVINKPECMRLSALRCALSRAARLRGNETFKGKEGFDDGAGAFHGNAV